VDWRTNERSVLVAGFAQLPKGTTLYETQKMIGCVLIIDRETHVILDVSFTFLMELTNEFISALIRGKSVADGIDEIVHTVEQRFLVPPQRAVLQALRAAYERYCELVRQDTTTK
jgi:hypothetical protein